MARAKYRYLPHTADAEFIAYGKSYRELVENAAHAMLGIMFEVQKIKSGRAQVKTLRITEEARGKEELLWFTLQKIISKVDEKGLNAFGFKVNQIVESESGMKLHGCIFYKRTHSYVALLDIKAVTPHGLYVKRSGGRYSAHVLVDV